MRFYVAGITCQKNDEKETWSGRKSVHVWLHAAAGYDHASSVGFLSTHDISQSCFFIGHPNQAVLAATQRKG